MEVIKIAFYHCLNTYGENIEFLTVLNKNSELIVNLETDNSLKVKVPDILIKEYNEGNVLATYHNHFYGAIIPSYNDFNNSILPKIPFSVITSDNHIGIFINENDTTEIHELILSKYTLFHEFINFRFFNEKESELENLKLKYSGDEFIKEKNILFYQYLSDNLEFLVNEFNMRMKNYKIYYIYIII